MTVAFITVAVFLLLALAGCVMLWREREAMRAGHAAMQTELAVASSQRDDVAADRAKLEAINEAHLAKLTELQAELSKLREREANLREQYDAAIRQSREAFDALAAKALKGTTDEFLKLARQVFEAEQQKANKSLETYGASMKLLLDPMRETLNRYQTAVQELEKSRKEAYGTLQEQLRAMSTDHQSLRRETSNLVTALRRPEVRGRWGELQMQRLLELSGLQDHYDFDAQASTDAAAGGKLRPDYIIRLPGDKVIVVDTKTPMDAFLAAIEATDDDQREELYLRHARQILDATRKLASKQYQDACDGSADFVVMFIPGESFLYPAVQRQPDLIEQAMASKVVIATPTVLLALLKAVAMGWREQRLAETADAISKQGRELHERLCTFAGHLADIGKALNAAGKAFDGAVGSLDRNLVPAVRKLEELHAKSAKDWPDDRLDALHITTRDIKSLPASPTSASAD